ncbi:MAG TPA: DUF4199 domain-containing protein, partial [Chitinophagales bacterium]
RKYVLTYGLLLGALLSASMIYMVYKCYSAEGFAGNEILGYIFIFVGHLAVFFGAFQYRNKELGGFISFGEAFKVAALIAFVASTIYVITWLFCYYFFVPDFMEKYAPIAIQKAQQEGKDVAAVAKEMAQFKEWYKNPIFIVLLTYMEVLPIGLVVALVSALILKKKKL